MELTVLTLKLTEWPQVTLMELHEATLTELTVLTLKLTEWPQVTQMELDDEATLTELTVLTLKLTEWPQVTQMELHEATLTELPCLTASLSAMKMGSPSRWRWPCCYSCYWSCYPSAGHMHPNPPLVAPLSPRW